MGHRVELTYYCDLTEASKHAAVDTIETVSFSTTDGKPREIDLCELHREQYVKAISPFLDASRITSSSSRVTQLRPRSRTARTDKEQLAAVRQWARDNGKQISDKGRIPEAIFAEYNNAAH